MHGCVVFDNNAYQAAGIDRFERLREAERASGIVPRANIIVLQELLAHVRDADDRERRAARAAIARLGQHCMMVDDDTVQIRFLQDTQAQAHRLFTGTSHPGDQAKIDRLAELIRIVSNAGRDGDVDEISEELAAIERFVTDAEEFYIADLQREISATPDTNNMRRNLEYSARIARRAHKVYGLQFIPEVAIHGVLPLAQLTPISFHLHDELVLELRANKTSPANHGNTLWDEEVVSSTSPYSTVLGQSILLVTEERRLSRAAKTANAQHLVCNLDEYEQILGLDPWKKN